MIKRIVLAMVACVFLLRIVAQEPSQETSVDELHTAGMSAYNAKQYERSVELLKRVTERDPKHKWAWNNLGRAYRSLGRHEEAVASFKRQTELDPFDEYAYNNLALSLWQLGRKSEAEAAFRKQIEVNPLDRWAHKNLGRFLSEERRYREALSSLDTARRITPDDKIIAMLLVTCHLNLGEQEKAKEILRQVQADGPPPGWFAPVDPLVKKLRDSWDPEAALAASKKKMAELVQQLSKVDLKAPNPHDLVNSDMLFQEWALTGDAYLRKGDLAAAEKYLSAAWHWSRSGVVADRLAQVYEKTERKDKAIEYYQWAIFAMMPHPDSQFALGRLMGGMEKADAAVRENRTRFTRFPPEPFETKGARDGSGTYLLAFEGSTLRGAARSIGAEVGGAVEKGLVKQKIETEFPDEKRPRIVRMAVVFCNAQQCSYTLRIPGGMGMLPVPNQIVVEQSPSRQE